MGRIIRNATRERAWTRTRFMGASNSGKTLSSLYLAQGLTDDHMERVCVIDTEEERSRLFSPVFGNRFDVLPLKPPFSPERYIEAMNEALAERIAIASVEQQRYEVVIIDSGSHEWGGPGGVLSEIDRIKKSSKNRDEQYAVWGVLTPRHDAFVEACIIRPAAHIIFCSRAKGDYEEVVQGNGQKKRVKVGLVDIQREGLEFEFTFGFRLEGDHLAYVEKDTSFIPDKGSLFDGQPPFVVTPQTGRRIIDWLNLAGGQLITTVTPPTPPPTPPPAPPGDDPLKPIRAKVLGLFKTALPGADRDKLVNALARASSTIFSDGKECRAFMYLSALEAQTIIDAVERLPSALVWYDIAQQRVVPKPTPTVPAGSLFNAAPDDATAAGSRDQREPGDDDDIELVTDDDMVSEALDEAAI